MKRRHVAVCGIAALMGLVLAGCSAAGASTRPADGAWHPAHDTGYGSAGAPTPSASASGRHRPGGSPTPSTSPSTSPAAPGSGPGSGPEAGVGPASGSPSPSPALTGKGLQLAMDKTSDGSVALTFDDGPSQYTPQILAVLKQYNVKATFCLVGIHVKEHPDLVQQIVAAGHTLCNHTWKHDEHLGDKSPDAIRQDLQMTNDEIHKAVPDAVIKYFRHPAGNFTPAAVEVATSLGMTSLGWNGDPTDWDLKANKPGATFTAKIANYVRTHTHAGTIMLSHDAGGDRSSTIAAYKQLIPALKQKYTLAALPTS